MEFNWFDHITALFLVIILPMMSLRSEKISTELIESLPPKKHLFYSNGLMLIISSLLVLTSWNISDRHWSELGMRLPELQNHVLHLTLLLAVIYFLDIMYGWFNRKYMQERLQEMAYVIPTTWKEYRHYTFLAFAAGISEEVIFRGFLITYIAHYLTNIMYGDVIAVIIPAVVFSLSHLYQGWWSVFKIMVIAILLGFIFLQSGSLLLVVVIHVLIDLISGVMGVVSLSKNSGDNL